jgi:hypothetical protein
MTQRIDFESLPNTRPEQVVGKLHEALSIGGGPDGVAFKAYRAHLRELGLWDKNRASTMMSLVDVSWDRTQVSFGPLAREILGMPDEDTIGSAVFGRLRTANILLVKYVFDALDVDGGGRLHSDHELYRMITSYVYPGEYITLPSFQAWIHWMSGAGYLKIVGIRWALTQRALEVLPEIRNMDVEEILEDLAEEAAKEESSPAAAAPEAPVAAPPVVAVPEATLDPVEAGADDEEDDLPGGMPPEPEPPSEEDVAKAEAEFVAAFGDVDKPESRPAMAAETPVAPLVLPEPAGVVAPSADLPLIAAQLVSAWDEGTQWPSYTAAQLGVDMSEARDPGELLVELGSVALLIEGLAVQPQVFSFVGHLGASGFFQTLALGGIGDALDALDLAMTSPAHQALSERLIHAHGIAARVAAGEDLLAAIAGVASPRDAVYVIHESLLGGTGKEASFWVLRELVRAQRVPESLGACAVVPSRRLLEHAHRLGIVPRTDLDTLEDLTVASCAVAASFGPESGYGEALEVMDRLMVLGREAP